MRCAELVYPNHQRIEDHSNLVMRRHEQSSLSVSLEQNIARRLDGVGGQVHRGQKERKLAFGPGGADDVG